MAIYGTTEIPSDHITVTGGGTISVSAAFATTVGIVGGMDTANGTATEGEAVRVESPSDAEDKFGADSELAKTIATIDGSPTIYAAPVTETSTTESFSSAANGTLSDVPFDPKVHPEHDITAQDTTDSTSVAVNISYQSPPPTPSDADTMNLNPVTREWEADSSSSYDITYDYGNYSEAIQAVTNYIPRFVAVCTENTEIANTLTNELDNYAQNFDFMHGIVGAMPEIEASSYSHNFDNRRLSVVAPSRAYTDEANTKMVRTIPAVAGKQCLKSLGSSTTYDSIGGFADLHTKYGNGELGTLIDAGVLPLKQSGGMFIVKDMTTSTDTRFERIYASEVTDEATEISHRICQQYIGEANTESNRFTLGESHDTSYAEMKSDNLLDDYGIAVEEGADPNQVNLDIALDIVDVMDTISVEIVVGDVIQNGGAS